MIARHWSEPYVGLPFAPMGRTGAGVDCWGLCALVYREVAQIDLPAFTGAYVTAEERADIAALVAGQKHVGPWVEIARGDEADLDILVFDCLGFQSHVGIVCERGRMLHATAGKLSGVERYDNGPWRHRLAGIYRHRMRA